MVKDIYFDLLDESIVSNIREKKAKPNKSIIEHTNDLLDVLEILWNLGYIKEERIYELIQKACIYHDIGKINKEFQKRVKNKGIKFDENNIHIIEGAGVDRFRFSYQPEPTQNKFSVLFASRLLWSKGLGEVVEAISKVKQNENNTTLYVAGILDDKDPDRIELDQILQWEKEGKIIWLGRRDDIQNLIRNSHVVILPTKYSEGVPRIIIEACAMGRSCIVGNVPGCKAIIKDNFNGCVLKTHSANEIAEKIEYLRDNMEIRKKFGLRSAEIVKERFSKEIVIDKTLCVYNKILSTTKR